MPRADNTTESVLERIRSRGFGDLIEGIARVHHVTMLEIASKTHTPAPTRARHEAWRILREAPYRLSYPEIGRLFGRHHTTIMGGVRNAMERNA